MDGTRVSDSTYDDLMDMLAREETPEEARLVEELRATPTLPPPPVLPPTPAVPKYLSAYDFNPSTNVLDPSVQKKFITGLRPVDDIFTTPIPTTFTMEGFISSVSHSEEAIVHLIATDENVLVVHSNYGKYVYPGYTPPVQVKLTNKGRKKKEREKKPRKKQGNGDCFASQVSLWIRSQEFIPTVRKEVVVGAGRTECVWDIPSDVLVYKFKVFRNGKIQLPGVIPSRIEDVISAIRIIVSVLNFYLHPGEFDIAKQCRVVSLTPVMQNYKFMIRQCTEVDSVIVDLMAFRWIIGAIEGDGKPPAEQSLPRYLRGGVLKSIVDVGAASMKTIPARPKVVDPKYHREESRLSLTFLTPTPTDPEKMVRVNFFMRGNVNILGANDIESTLHICNYLSAVIDIYAEYILVEEPSPPPAPHHVDNISMSIEELVHRASARRYAQYPAVEASLIDYAMRAAEAEWEEQCREAEDYIARALSL